LLCKVLVLLVYGRDTEEDVQVVLFVLE